jgi:hypothetical protein
VRGGRGVGGGGGAASTTVDRSDRPEGQ